MNDNRFDDFTTLPSAGLLGEFVISDTVLLSKVLQYFAPSFGKDTNRVHPKYYMQVGNIRYCFTLNEWKRLKDLSRGCQVLKG